jgi:hypothetical protein
MPWERICARLLAPSTQCRRQVEIACGLGHRLALFEHQPHRPRLELIGELPALSLAARSTILDSPLGHDRRTSLAPFEFPLSLAETNEGSDVGSSRWVATTTRTAADLIELGRVRQRGASGSNSTGEVAVGGGYSMASRCSAPRRQRCQGRVRPACIRLTSRPERCDTTCSADRESANCL